MLDFNHASGLKIAPPDFADHVNAAIDAGILARRAKEARRNYLGASLLGDPCDRRLVYMHSGVEPDEPFTARTIRIFDVGHGTEDFLGGVSEYDQVFTNAAVRWFHDAGFNLKTRGHDGKQFGWKTLEGRVQGHIDGVLLNGPPIPDLKYPALWECKSANKKNWSKLKKHGVRIGSGTYFGQMQLNMAYLDVFQTVFTVVNKDSSEVNHELIEFDPKVAQQLSDRALEIITMVGKSELPDRIASQPDYYVCKMCSYRLKCWNEKM